LIDATHPEWSMISMQRDIRDSFSRILESDQEKYVERVRQLISRYSTVGVTGFDELMN
jgi:hypothetical protein